MSVETNIESIDDGHKVEASSNMDYNYDMSFTSGDEDYQYNDGKKVYFKQKITHAVGLSWIQTQ